MEPYEHSKKNTCTRIVHTLKETKIKQRVKEVIQDIGEEKFNGKGG